MYLCKFCQNPSIGSKEKVRKQKLRGRRRQRRWDPHQKQYVPPPIRLGGHNISPGAVTEGNLINLAAVEKTKQKNIIELQYCTGMSRREIQNKIEKNLSFFFNLKKTKFLHMLVKLVLISDTYCIFIVCYTLLLPFKKLILVLMLNKAWRNSQSKAE